MSALRLNLGCGEKRLPGFINVDRFGTPDVRHDLEVLPWPWPDSSVSEILLSHVLEHLGHDPRIFLAIMQEMYRVCEGGASIQVIVPHFRHDFFFSDPTHVRAITPLGMSLFSQKQNREWIRLGAANSPLGLYLGVNFEVIETTYKPGAEWFRRHPGPEVSSQLLLAEGALYNNLIEEIRMLLRIIK